MKTLQLDLRTDARNNAPQLLGDDKSISSDIAAHQYWDTAPARWTNVCLLASTSSDICLVIGRSGVICETLSWPTAMQTYRVDVELY